MTGRLVRGWRGRLEDDIEATRCNWREAAGDPIKQAGFSAELARLVSEQQAAELPSGAVPHAPGTPEERRNSYQIAYRERNRERLKEYEHKRWLKRKAAQLNQASPTPTTQRGNDT